MTTTVDRRVVEIDVRTAASMQAEIKRAANSVGALEKSLGGLKGMIAEFGAGLAASFTVGAFVSALKDSIEVMDQIGKRSQQIGVTTESLSALTFQAKLAGVEAQELDVGLIKLNKGLADLGKESTASTKALERLGVVAGTSTDDALAQVAEQFKNMEDGPEKTALAVDIFGKAGARLIPMLNDGAEGLAKFRAEAERLGIVISQESAAAAEEFNDNLSRLVAGIHGVTLQISQGLLPALTQVTQAFEGSTESGDRWKSFGEGLGSIVKFLTGVFLTLWGAVQTTGRAIGAYMTILDALVERRFKAIPGILADLGQDVKQITADTVASIEKLNEPFVAPQLKSRSGAAPDDPAAKVKELNKELERLNALTGQAAADKFAADMELVTNAFFDGKISVQAYDNALAKLSGTTNGLTKEQKKAAEELARIEAITGRAAEQQLASDIELLNRAWAEGAVTMEEYAKGMNKTLGLSDKVKDTTKEQTDAFLEMGKAIQQSVEGWSGAAADAILNFATGAEQDITKMVEGILRQFAKMALQKMVLDPLFSAAGSGLSSMFKPAPAANGAVFNPGGTVRAFAEGGVVSSPTVFPFANGVGVMGEAGPEAIMPLQRNAQGQLGVSGGGDVTVNVVNQAGVQVGVESGRSSNGQREVTVLIQRAVADGFARGRFDSVMGATYGLNRQGR